jgi:hypothetical protein
MRECRLKAVDHGEQVMHKVFDCVRVRLPHIVLRPAPDVLRLRCRADQPLLNIPTLAPLTDRD